MGKIDYKKELSDYYLPSNREVAIIDVPLMNFLMIDGRGDPNTSKHFQEAVECLFGLSYTLKFMIKKGPAAIEYAVMPLEGLWWADEMTTFSTEDKSNWFWTLMIMQPEHVTPDLVGRAMETLRDKNNPPALERCRFDSLREGPCAQIMHIGPFSEEGPTVERVHAAIEQLPGKRCGKHHEIYLSDFRRARPERLKTIIRQPFERIR